MSTPSELIPKPAQESTTPSYLLAAQSHSDLNSATLPDQNVFDAASDIVTKALPLSIASGVNQLYNTVPSIGNFLDRTAGGSGNAYELSDFNSWIAEQDSDLSKYYQDHKLGVDVMGFALSSMVPGMAGVKVLNAGQTVLRAAINEGKFGSLTGNALGLLAPQRLQHIEAAVSSIRQTGNVFALTEANTLRALVAGAGQNALEGAAFTTLVNATMFNSPVLEGRDVSDLVHDVLIGGALGGVIGGAIAGVGAAYKIKKAGAMAEKELSPWTITDVPTSSMSTSDKILFRLNTLEKLPPLPTTGDLVARTTSSANATKNKLMLEIREDFNTLAGGDTTLAELRFQQFKVSNWKTNVENFMDSESISRLSARSSTENKLAEIKNILKKANGDRSKLTPEELHILENTQVSYVKNFGENIGEVSSDRPTLLNLADRLQPGETISLTKTGVQVGKKHFANDNNPYRSFNIMGVSHLQTEARYAWSEMLPKWVDGVGDIPVIHATDIPLLQKAYKDGISNIKVIPEGLSVSSAISYTTKESIENLLKRQKVDIGARLLKAQTMPTDLNTFVDKIKGYFGINFNVVDDPTVNGFFIRIGKNLVDGNQTFDLTGDAIALSKQSILKRSLAQNMSTLKHEEGHSIFQALLDSHGITKQNLGTAYPKLVDEVVRISKAQRPWIWKSTDPKNIEYRNSAHELFADAFSWLSHHHESLKNFPEFNKFAGHLVRPIPQEILDAVSKRATKPSIAEAAKIVDMEISALSGTIRDNGFFARDNARAKYAELLKNSKARESESAKDIFHLPSYSKILSNSSRVRSVNGIEIDAATILRAEAKQYDESADRIATQYLKERLPGISDEALLTGENSGPTILAAENGNYGTRSSWGAYIGQRTSELINKFKASTTEVFTPVLHKISNDINSAIEFSTLNEKLRNLPQKYFWDDVADVLNYDGTDAVSLGIPEQIAIKSTHVKELIQLHIQKNAQRLEPQTRIRANEGLPNSKSPKYFYPIPRDPKDTPFFAYVIDDTVTGTGHSKMIYAKSGKELELLKQKVLDQGIPGLKVLSKTESEDYFKARGQYEYERTLNENYINNSLTRKGVSSSYFPTTDPKKIVTNFLNWHLARDASLVRELVAHRFSRQFETLRAAAEPALQASKSKFGWVSPQAYAENSVNNPASNLIKLALNIQKIEEYPFWSTMNRQLDSKASEVITSVSKLWTKVTHPEQLNDINKALQDAGYNGPLVDDTLYSAMNGKIDRGILTSFVNKANAVVGSLALRLDPLNALNNGVGHAVLFGTEAKAVLSAIKNSNAEAVGDLAKLGNVLVPGTSDSVLSTSKILANSFNRLANNPGVKQWHKDHGFITTIMHQYDQTLDAIAIRSSDSSAALSGRIIDGFKTVGDVGERLTGNRVTEEFNRFLAADFMKQITDIAVKHGVLSEEAALSYINTFVNRTQGNFIASQRPILFQGPIGQAIGLFQTYQFNLIQQLLRHVGEGQGKNAAIMMGLQAGIYGLNGLPAFNAINTYIIGNAPGNVNHTDLYQSVFSGAGKEAGEWLTYGTLSNAFSLFNPELKTNMYNRGDVNPRQLTVVPVNPANIPLVNTATKFFGNIKDSISQLAMGAGVWNTFLRSLEHNGVSRPLTGIAQVLSATTNESGEVIATSQQGNILMVHDLLTLSSGVRILGGKPMDEAIVQDQMFRNNTYRSYDAAKRQSLAEAIKTTILGDGEPSDEQLNSFAESYAKYGGKQTEFAQFMTKQYANTSETQAEQLRKKLLNPYAQQLQRIMEEN